MVELEVWKRNERELYTRSEMQMKKKKTKLYSSAARKYRRQIRSERNHVDVTRYLVSA
jgi:hypothetical protein